MADSDLITVAPGVTRDDWPGTWRFYGTKEALIASGLFRAEWFVEPGLRHHRGTRRSKTQRVDGLRITTTIPPKGTCVACIQKTKEEIAEYEAREASKDLERTKTRAASEAEKKKFYEVELLNGLIERTAAAFAVGDVVWYEACQELVEIDEEFALYDVQGDGWRWGYVVRFLGGKKHFIPAGELSRDDGSIQHIKLVSGNPARQEREPDPGLPRAS